MNLYRTILGDRWNRVDPGLRKLHSDAPSTQALCTMNVTGGPNPAARLLARALGLPKANAAATVRLTVRRFPGEEIWEREFPDRRLTSRQSVSEEGRLVESFGRVVFWLDLTGDEGGIDLHVFRAFICAGSSLLTLPGWLAPMIHAREEASPGEEGIRISVELKFPGVGRLVKYEGTVRVQL